MSAPAGLRLGCLKISRGVKDLPGPGL